MNGYVQMSCSCCIKCFQLLQILEHLDVGNLPPDEQNKHVVRCGWSTQATSMQLGEEKNSFGYGGTGKASTDCKFKDYGQTFQEGDVIACHVVRGIGMLGYIEVRSWKCGCLVIWFWYELIAKPCNKTVAHSWPDLYIGRLAQDGGISRAIYTVSGCCNI